MIIPEHIIDQIREQADIVEIINESVHLRKKGRNYVALSPFTDEKTPSFTVSPEKQIFKDFSSGIGGNVYKFVMEYHRMTFPEAVEYVAEKVGIRLEKNKSEDDFAELDRRQKAQKAINLVNEIYKKELGNPKNIIALNYFFGRGLNNDLVVKFGLGYSPDSWDIVYNVLKKQKFDEKSMEDCGVIVRSKNGTSFDRFKGRAIFPLRDHIGRVVGFSGRQLVIDKKSGKYINSPQCLLYDKSKLLYGLFESKDSIRNRGEVILVEGQLDVISLHKVGIENVVASSGTALTEYQIELMSRYAKKIYFIYDSDEAGIKAASKGVDIALKKELDVKIVQLPDGEDPDSIIQKSGKNTFNIYLDHAIDFVEFQVNIYKKKNPKESAQSRSLFIRKIVKSISMIPDRLQHDHYVGRLAHFMDLNNHELGILYSEKKKSELKEIKKNEFKDNDELKVHKKDDLYEESRLEQDDSLRVTETILPEELILLKYALQGFEELNRMTDEFEVSVDTFVNEDAKNLFNILSNLENIKGKNILEIIQDSEYLSDEIKSLLLGLTLLGEEKSINWSKYRNLGIEHNLNEDMADSLIKLELKSLDLKSKSLLSLLSDDNELTRKNELKQDLIELSIHKRKLLDKLEGIE